jgi:hypothetical protein
VQTDYLGNLSIAHALSAQVEDGLAQRVFIWVAEITFGRGG